MNLQKLGLCVLSVIMLCFIAVLINYNDIIPWFKPEYKLAKLVKQRTSSDELVFDYAHLLEYSKENTEAMLRHIRDKYGVEVLMLTIPSTEGQEIGSLAAEISTNWGIGKELSGRGVLLLLAEKEKLIKVEVGFGAEPVYTDLFCGYIERMQLKTYFENNQVDEGLAATLEEFIGRAEGRLTDDELKEKLSGFLSGGAGIEKAINVGDFTTKDETAVNLKAEGELPQTPQRLLEVWLGVLKKCVNQPNLPIYSEATQVMFRYGRSMDAAMCSKVYSSYSSPSELKVKEPFAVVLYPGDDKAGPVFMFKNKDGWQLDMVSTSKWVRYGYNNIWFLGGRNHPYSFAFDSEFDTHVHDQDFYDDYGMLSSVRGQFQSQITQWEKELQRSPNNYQLMVDLGELYFDLSVAHQAAKLLKKAITIAPNEARAYRALGLVNRDAFSSPDAAKEYLEKYAELNPDDPNAYHYLAVVFWRKASREKNKHNFEEAGKLMLKYAERSSQKVYGYKMAGWFYYKAGRKSEAKRLFEQILKLDPKHEYAKSMLLKL